MIMKTTVLRRLGAAFALGGFLALAASASAEHPAVDTAGAAGATETAALNPGWGPMDSDPSPSSLSRPLSDVDADLYARIFAIQHDGRWDEADALIKAISDPVLMGHVLFQRYMHPTKYRSAYRELKGWMDQHADHPGADRIYALALRRQPAGASAPLKPQSPMPDDILETAEAAADTRSTVTRAASSRARSQSVRNAQNQIERWVQAGYVTRSLDYLSQSSIRSSFDPVSRAESLGIVARGYYRYHKDEEAVAVAKEAVKLAGAEAVDASWWGGLAAFRSQRFDVAAGLFETLAGSDAALPRQRSAGGFWASRAHLVSGKPDRVTPMLLVAAEEQRTFYGLLALRALGLKPSFDWEMPHLDPVHNELLERIPAARRAIALIQVGESTLAEAELARLVRSLPDELAPVLLAAADAGGLANLAYRVGSDLERRRGLKLDAALYPLPAWAPLDGFAIDRAVLFAFVRQESRFLPDARSWAGASGLMQLMPATAGFVANRNFSGAARHELYDPAYNLSLGQKYLQMLLDDPEIGNNLFYALAAYNAGPGNLKKWRSQIDYIDDPLIFIESMPLRETRLYIEHVLANLWIYRHRLGQETPTLDALLAGRWPIYISLDDRSVSVRTASTVQPLN